MLAKSCKVFRVLWTVKFNASVMELVDMTDSKSVASDSVAVQVRPLVPSLLYEVDTKTDLRVGFFVPF